MTLPQSNGKMVLVFDINGYIAFSISLELLKEGYTLCETARTIKSMKALLQGAYKEYADCCEMIVVSDMTVPRAFNKAVKGMKICFYSH